MERIVTLPAQNPILLMNDYVVSSTTGEKFLMRQNALVPSASTDPYAYDGSEITQKEQQSKDHGPYTHQEENTSNQENTTNNDHNNNNKTNNSNSKSVEKMSSQKSDDKVGNVPLEKQPLDEGSRGTSETQLKSSSKDSSALRLNKSEKSTENDKEGELLESKDKDEHGGAGGSEIIEQPIKEENHPNQPDTCESEPNSYKKSFKDAFQENENPPPAR